MRGAGFLLNNEMIDFNSQPGVTTRDGQIGTEPNLIAPGKRMLSSRRRRSWSKDGKPVLVTGSPGGRTIINTVLSVVVNVIDFDMDAARGGRRAAAASPVVPRPRAGRGEAGGGASRRRSRRWRSWATR